MNNKAILFIPVLSIFLYACSGSGDSQYESDNDDGVEPVRVMTLDYSTIARSATYTAHLQAYDEVHLAPASPGRVEKIHVDIGSRVTKGQLLVEMDKTQLHQAKVQLQNIETDFRRLDTLRKAGSISRQQYDQVFTQYELARSNVEFLRDNTRLLAPFSATVSEKYFENGEMFSGAPNTAAGKAAVLSLVGTDRLKAIVNVAERYFPYIQPGMEVQVSSDVYPGKAFSGEVSRVYPTIDPATRSFRLEIVVPNPEEKLRPGMFARARLELEEVEAFVVPALAVMKLQGSNERYIFLEENGRAKRVVVEPGERYDDMIELISEEVTVGDRLIVAGQSRLLDGVAVRVMD